MRARCWLTWCVLLGLSSMVAACAAPSSTATPNLVERAAAEATALVQRAQATALVLHAQATATALARPVAEAPATPLPTSTVPTAANTPAPAATKAGPTAIDDPSPAADSTEVEVVSVGFAVEGGLIVVRFRAPPKEAEKWWQGSVSVTDEKSGMVYNEIPLLPKVGLMIGRPKVEGQLGYVMLVNPPPYLRSGVPVTVVLGNYTFEHITVQ